MIDKLYQYFVDRRNRQYDSGKYQSKRVSVPVISVGNLSAGGAGKTPMIINCSSILSSANITHGIVSHGYKRSSKEPFVFRSGTTIANSQNLGDEGCLILRNAKADVGVSDSKYDTAKNMSLTGEYECLLVDDGFQHRQLYRDLDIVIIDNSTVRNPHLLPKGRLREPIESIRRADVVIFRDISDTPFLFRQYLDNQLVLFGKTVLKSPISFAVWISNKQTDDVHTSGSKAAKIIAMSGLARNTGFHKSLKKAGKNLLGTIELKDHHKYSKADISSAINLMKKVNAEHIAITEKDAIKLEELRLSEYEMKSLYVYSMSIDIDQSDAFKDKLLSIFT